MQIAPGTRIGDYGVERLLGSGGMGSVFLCRHVSNGAEVALKVMNPEAAQSEQFRKRFVREARVTMALDHKNVIRILDCFEHDGQPVIAMEVLRGCSLTDSLHSNATPGLPRIAAVMTRVTSAVGTAHAMGLVHRDLKPDNIFLLEADPHVKVLDFGIAKMRKGYGLEESSALTRTGMLVGTPYYMSPEQAFGEKSIDHRADIWSLGLILHESLLGVLPTRADTLQEVLKRLVSMKFQRLDAVDRSIPKDVADLVEKMVTRERDARPTDLREVYQVLAKYAEDLGAAPMSFGKAATPLMLDEDTSQTVAIDTRPDSSVAPSGSTQPSPLKLTPQSLRAQSAAGGQQGTLLIDAPASRPSAPQSPPSKPGSLGGQTLASPGGPGSVTPLATTPEKRSAVWMWVVAGVLVVLCVVVLVTQLR